MKRAQIIGISGGSGSGKSSLVKRLVSGRFGNQISVLKHDDYYLSSSRNNFTTTTPINWDHPDSLDNSLFVEHIDQLASGLPICSPVYDFTAHARADETNSIKPNPIILLDGILLFAVAEIAKRIDLKVYVETPPDLRIVRRVKRDLEERGRNIRSIAEQYEQSVRPMHDLLVEPSKLSSHVLVPWIEENLMAARLIEGFIAESVESHKI